MEAYLSRDSVPVYCASNWRRFEPQEHHVTRICREDVALFLVSGVLRFHEDGTDTEVGPGEYYIQKRGLLQEGRRESDKPYYYYVHFLGTWSAQSGIPLRGKYTEETKNAVLRLEACRIKSGSLLEKTAAFLTLLSSLSVTRPLSEKALLAERIRNLLHVRVHDGITAEELSDTVRFSQSYVARVFREYYGVTPYRYLSDLRMDRAWEMVQYSDLSLEKIAEECGFEDYTSFYRAWMARNPLSPRKQRQEHI